MSSGLAVRELSSALGEACVVAWSVTKWFPEMPRTAISASDLPAAIIEWQPVAMSFDGPLAAVGIESSVQQDYRFRVRLYEAFPEGDDPVALVKSDRADALIAQVQAANVLGGVGLLPLVASVDPADDPDAPENCFSLTCEVTCSAVADHHETIDD